MKLPAFAYQRAESLEEATALLASHGADARVLAGGQSLLPVMALRMSQPALLVDITKAADLSGHAIQNGRAVVSAAVTARTAEQSAGHPLLTECLAKVGHVEIRTRGTVCGAVAHADPAAEMPALLLALDGAVRVASDTRRRRVAAADFFLGPYLTALEEGELVAGIELPEPAPTARASVLEIARRDGDFALVGVITVLDAGPDGRCTDARIALFGVAGTAKRATVAEQVLVGAELTPQVLTEAAAYAFDGFDVVGDLHGSATYRRKAGVRLVEKSLRAALPLEVTHA
ncbi:xanthine dehydrogenase family protein subunit M [Kribbella pittospori]|uniref:Xanthine dehydrogenase family protein subunit M n=1 Tax=Kribbella pittospori TaxID=722689 RepID=A0A4R0KBI5_9ACTN|nr:FAD binding domain-containing protein [Kribbella pittospori]TCC57691.1 xanthine dehydrogenase family protein subunit M [Kribbella pittospori]